MIPGAAALGRSSSKTTQGLAVGVTSADFDPTTGLPGDEGWLYAPVNGNLIVANQGVSWAGQEMAAEGDLIGMLLDRDLGTLSVFLNGQRLGVMARGRGLQAKPVPPPVRGQQRPPVAAERERLREQQRAEEAVPPRPAGGAHAGMDLRAHLPMCESCRQHPALFCLPADGMRRRWCAPCAAGIPGAANPPATIDEAAGRMRPAAAGRPAAYAAEDEVRLDVGTNELLRRRRALDEGRQREERSHGGSGALCWCVDLGWEGGVVTIEAKGPPR